MPPNTEWVQLFHTYSLMVQKKPLRKLLHLLLQRNVLVLIFAVKRFHKMIYGRHFTLLTELKSLVSIFGSRKDVRVHSGCRAPDLEIGGFEVSKTTS